MAISPNYSWPLPDDDDLVKDGAEAIRDLGNAIDTTVNDLGVGLHHINSTSFSAVASQSINDVFSATYDHYVVFADILLNGATDQSLFIKMRASGTDSSTNYNYQTFLADATTLTGSRSTGQTQGIIGNATSAKDGYQWNFHYPFQATNTKIASINGSAATAASARFFDTRVTHNVDSAFDGFTIFVTGGGVSITGTVTVLGVKK